MDSLAGSYRHAGPGAPQRRHSERTRRATARRVRRILVCAALIALLPAAVSYVGALTEPSNSSFGIRSVEWLRDHGAAPIVAKVESVYYSLTAPAKGGPALRALPRTGVQSPPSLTAQGPGALVDRPRRIAPLAQPALPGEGIWSATMAHESRNDPPLLVTTFRSDPSEYPRLVAGVAWINASNTRISLYAGRLEPSVELPSRGPMEVPPDARAKLLATFNSGFKLADSHGGWALNGRTYAPMREGQATFVRYADGRYDVVSWHGGPRVGESVVFARQNLPLLLEDGQLSRRLANGSEWGATVGNAVQVWRSGIGIDAHGNLLYAAANYQTASSLAKILRHAGAVRAMELDINSYWISFNTYAAPGALEPGKLLSETERPATRYLSPDDRDFFAVFSR
ncbi:MAG: phosphodiester glycosidase family protein [Solirubrobacteraceae bacterium]